MAAGRGAGASGDTLDATVAANGGGALAQDARPPGSQLDAQSDTGMALDAAIEPDSGDDSDASPSDTAPSPDAMPGRSCQPGSYVGDFTCTVDPTGVTPLTAMSHVTFELQQTSANAALTITTSDFSFDLLGFFFAANLSGTLDCVTGNFHADILNGILTSILPPIAAPFNGLIDGQIDGSARTLAGNWSFVAPSGSTCSGPWSASLQP